EGHLGDLSGHGPRRGLGPRRRALALGAPGRPRGVLREVLPHGDGGRGGREGEAHGGIRRPQPVHPRLLLLRHAHAGGRSLRAYRDSAVPRRRAIGDARSGVLRGRWPGGTAGAILGARQQVDGSTSGAREGGMASVTSISASRKAESVEWQLRVDLAAAFRLAADFGWHEAVANHFSLAVSADGKKFLMNPRWRHFARVKASELQLLDADDKTTMSRPDAPDASAWCIHGHMHGALPQARCILHCHPPYATAIASLADPDLKPIEQNTARYYRRLAIDREFGGIADNEEEGRRLVRVIGDKKQVILGNHGVITMGNTVAEAFDDLYYLERACQTLVLAYSTGQPLKVLSHEIAETTARGWEDYKDAAFSHFDQLKAMLDAKDPSYKD